MAKFPTLPLKNIMSPGAGVSTLSNNLHHNLGWAASGIVRNFYACACKNKFHERCGIKTSAKQFAGDSEWNVFPGQENGAQHRLLSVAGLQRQHVFLGPFPFGRTYPQKVYLRSSNHRSEERRVGKGYRS